MLDRVLSTRRTPHAGEDGGGEETGDDSKTRKHMSVSTRIGSYLARTGYIWPIFIIGLSILIISSFIYHTRDLVCISVSSSDHTSRLTFFGFDGLESDFGSLGVPWYPQLVKKIGAATALEMRATGIPYSFAPCIAVCRDPRWGRCYESYSEDPKIVQEMTEIIPGLQGDIPANSRKGVPYVAEKTKVAACAKHYVGDGGTTMGINGNNTEISKHGMLSIHMPPYYDSVINFF